MFSFPNNPVKLFSLETRDNPLGLCEVPHPFEIIHFFKNKSHLEKDTKETSLGGKGPCVLLPFKQIDSKKIERKDFCPPGESNEVR